MTDKCQASLYLTKFQFMYMMRPYLKVREGFLIRLCKNIEDIGLKNKELELTLEALAIKAFGSKLTHRQELCDRALDALENSI